MPGPTRPADGGGGGGDGGANTKTMPHPLRRHVSNIFAHKFAVTARRAFVARTLVRTSGSFALARTSAIVYVWLKYVWRA